MSKFVVFSNFLNEQIWHVIGWIQVKWLNPVGSTLNVSSNFSHPANQMLDLFVMQGSRTVIGFIQDDDDDDYEYCELLTSYFQYRTVVTTVAKHVRIQSKLRGSSFKHGRKLFETTD